MTSSIIKTQQIEGKSHVIVLKLHGEIDEFNIEDFKKEVNQEIKNDDVDIFIFDLKELKFINSIVISYFAELFSELNQNSRKMIFTEGNERIVDIFDLVGFFNLVEYYSTLDDALNSLEF